VSHAGAQRLRVDTAGVQCCGFNKSANHFLYLMEKMRRIYAFLFHFPNRRPMKRLFTSISLTIFFFLQLNAQTFKWAAQIGGTDYDTGEDIAFDASGNVYMVGIFNSTADFNPDSAATNTLTSAGAQDVYIVKLDSDKIFKWAVRIGGAAQDFAYAIAVSSGYVYVCGKFTSTADFDPGASTYNLTAAGGTDIFILKLDTASNFIWAKQIGSTGDDNVEKFTLDNSEHLLLCGEFSGTVDFDPGAGVQNLTSTASQDAYILKLDNDGNYIWAHRFGSNSGELAQAIATDAENSIYATGEFYGTIDFDPGPATYNLTASGFNANIFVLKWDSDGNFVWADDMGNSSGGDQGSAIKIDPSGNPVVTGSYFGAVDFDPGAGVYNLTATGTNGDIFVLKLNSSDGSLLWAVSMGGSTLDQPYALALNTAGNIIVSGLYSTTADFDPGVSVFNLTASGPDDAFIVELDNDGNFIWAYGLGGTQDDFSRGMNTHGTSDVYVCGVFAYTADFDPGPSTYNLTSFVNTPDVFLLKLRFCTPSTSSAVYNLCPGDSVFLGGAYQHNPGIYYDYYTAAGGCDSIVTTTVQYTFVLVQGIDIDACEGQTVLLDAGAGGDSYLWSTGATTQTVFVTSTGNYNVQVTKNGCTQGDTVQVTFHALPVVHLGNDTAICEGQPVILHGGNSGAAHEWSTGATTQNIIVSIAGTYWVKVTTSFGCIASDSIGVTVHPLPIILLGTDTVICTSSHITLDAGANFMAYQWQDGSTDETFTLDGSIGTGVYPLVATVTDSNGCINSDSILVNIEVCVGIALPQQSSLLVYPNPAEDFVIIRSGEMIREITFYNITGEMIIHRVYDSNINSILLSSLPHVDGCISIIAISIVNDITGWLSRYINHRIRISIAVSIRISIKNSIDRNV